MHTLEEINKEANSKAKKMFWVWILVFGVPMAIMTYITTQDSLASQSQIQSLILGDFTTLFGAGIMACVAFYNTKKKLKEENEQEERQERDEHYKRMEELLEKMSKNNNNNENDN